MKAIYYCTLFLVLSILTGCIDTERTDLRWYHLKGKVKELTNKRHKAVEKFGEITKGRLIIRSLDETLKYELLPQNSRISFSPEGKMEEISLYDREDNFLLKMKHRDTIVDFYTNDGSLTKRVIRDDYWFPNQIDTYNGEGDLMRRTKCTYKKGEDPFDRIMEEYDKDGDWAATSGYDYDAKDRLLSVSVERKDLYSRYGRYNSEGKITSKTETLLYEEGDYPVKVTIKEGKRLKVIDIVYTLDDKGNWTKAIETIDGKPYGVVERTIVYY